MKHSTLTLRCLCLALLASLVACSSLNEEERRAQEDADARQKMMGAFIAIKRTEKVAPAKKTEPKNQDVLVKAAESQKPIESAIVEEQKKVDIEIQNAGIVTHGEPGQPKINYDSEAPVRMADSPPNTRSPLPAATPVPALEQSWRDFKASLHGKNWVMRLTKDQVQYFKSKLRELLIKQRSDPSKFTAQNVVVAPNQTLQKISMANYGTTRKWPEIYLINSDQMRTADAVMAGKTLRIFTPVDKK